MKTVGVIGNGFVGNAIYQNFKEREVPAKVFDVLPEKAVDSYEDVLLSDYIFVCLPTPMMDSGECNVSYVTSFFEEVPQNQKGVFVLKSTVPIGTTRKISESRPDLKIIHNPEFLTAENAKDDFFNCDRNIFGGNKLDCLDLASFLFTVFPEWRKSPYYIVSSDESETIKYFSNCYLSVKISYFNNVFQTCEKLGMNYETVRSAITDDVRINKHHTKVPGPDGKLGYGGYCFPKDINALIHTLDEMGINSELLSSSWSYNQKIRKDS